jgi:hypothetical protein
MRKKKIPLRFMTREEANGHHELPVPKVIDRAKCPCCERSIPVRYSFRDWDRIKSRYVNTPNTKWFYSGYSYFCGTRCAIIHGIKSIEKKLKINPYE